MAIYFFQFSDGVRIYPDFEGVDLDDPGLVLDEAIKSGQGLARDLQADGVDCSSWTVVVLDEHRVPIMSLPLSSSMPSHEPLH